MEPNAPKQQDIVDTTDSLEAVGVCRSMKNFLFFVMLMALLLTQAIFWLDRLGLIDKPCTAGTGKACPVQRAEPAPADRPQANTASISLLPLTAQVNVAEEVEKVTEQDRPNPTTEAAAPDEDIVLETQSETMQAESEQAPDEAETQAEPFRIPCRFVTPALMICNFIIIAGAVLYCLTLLVCLKISLAGRLGGMSHITKAFFISLFLLVILFPWQQVLPRVLVGAVWLPGELFSGKWSKDGNAVIWEILFYLRFCGLWFLSVWFLFWAQIRTGKWARATLRRLGIVR